MIRSNIKKIALKYHVATFAAVMLLFFSCTKDKGTATKVTTNTKLSAQFTDAEVFVGVMFLNGPVAPLVGDYSQWSLLSYTNEQNAAQITQTENNLAAQLEQQNPGFLARFRVNVTSGDINIVTNAIHNAATMLEPLVGYNPQNQQAYTQQGTNFIVNNNLTPQSSISDVQAALIKTVGTSGPMGICICFDVAIFVQYTLAIQTAAVITKVIMWDASIAPDQVSAYMSNEYFAAVTARLAN